MKYSIDFLTILVTIWDLQCGEPDNVGDLEKQPFYKFIQSTYIIHLVAPGALLYSLGGLPYFVWGLVSVSIILSGLNNFI